MKKRLAPTLETSISRREFFKVAAATSAAFAIPHVWLKAAAAGPIKLGFIALTDSSSVIMAKELGLYKKYGVDVEVVKQASWGRIARRRFEQ